MRQIQLTHEEYTTGLVTEFSNQLGAQIQATARFRCGMAAAERELADQEGELEDLRGRLTETHGKLADAREALNVVTGQRDAYRAELQKAGLLEDEES